jgi:hypothetical protein
MVPSARRVPRDRGRTVVTLAHVAGLPVEEWMMPFIISVGAALVGMRAMFSSFKNKL